MNILSRDIKASLVYDGGPGVLIPTEMGEPKLDQMQGTDAENLAELCGRICYDSLGVGRSSKAYHEHIAQVKHLSVYEHFNPTIEFPYRVISAHSRDSGSSLHSFASVFLNRPGIYVQCVPNGSLEVTFNFRSIIEWYAIQSPFMGNLSSVIREAIALHCKKIAPMIEFPNPFVNLFDVNKSEVLSMFEGTRLLSEKQDGIYLFAEQAWVSLYLSGSRGFSHEQVRHGDWTAISQRSTRYCDESGTPLVPHPLISKALEDPVLRSCCTNEEIENVLSLWQRADDATRRAYTKLSSLLTSYGEAIGADHQTARKQARGAARGIMPNAMKTEMIFSASCAQWLRMIEQRFSPSADGEISHLYGTSQHGSVISSLKSSRFSRFFEHLAT